MTATTTDDPRLADLIASCEAVLHELEHGEASGGDRKDIAWCAAELREAIDEARRAAGTIGGTTDAPRRRADAASDRPPTLKSCPFCGERDGLIIRTFGFKRASVGCWKCGIHARTDWEPHEHLSRAEARVLAAWNRRPERSDIP